MAQDKPRKDRFERRTIWVLALAVVALVLPSPGFSLLGSVDWWNVALWIAGQTALVLSVGAAGLALMPRPTFLPDAIERRDATEFLSFAILFLWLGLALVMINLSITAVDAIGESGF